MSIFNQKRMCPATGSFGRAPYLGHWLFECFALKYRTENDVNCCVHIGEWRCYGAKHDDVDD